MSPSVESSSAAQHPPAKRPRTTSPLRTTNVPESSMIDDSDMPYLHDMMDGDGNDPTVSDLETNNTSTPTHQPISSVLGLLQHLYVGQSPVDDNMEGDGLNSSGEDDDEDNSIDNDDDDIEHEENNNEFFIDESVNPGIQSTAADITDPINCTVPAIPEFNEQLKRSLELYDIVQTKGITDDAYARLVKFINECIGSKELGNYIKWINYLCLIYFLRYIYI